MTQGNRPWRPFLMMALPLAGLVTVVALLTGQVRVDTALQRIGADEFTRVRLGKTVLVAALETHRRHLTSLRTERPVRAAIEDASPANLAGMSDAFASLLERNPEYDQARWIDETGREQVRVDRKPDGIGVVVVAAPDLRDRSARDFFADTVNLAVGETFISQLDLGNETTATANKPTLRFVTAIADRAGKRRGILVINDLAGPMLDEFSRTTGFDDRHVMLLDRQGHRLAGPDQADVASGRALTLGDRFPTAWARIGQSEYGQALEPSGLWTWETIALQTAGSKSLAAPHAPTWIVVSHPAAETIRSLRLRVWLPTAAIGALAVLLLTALSWLAAVRTQQKRDALTAVAAAAASRRRVAELEEAQKVGARLTAIIESTLDAIIGKKLDGTITSWNPGAERLFGYRADEAIGRNVLMLVSPDREPEERTILERIGRGETIAHFDTVRRHKDGYQIDVSVTISPIRDAVGRVIGASKIARDITDAKRAEATLREREARLNAVIDTAVDGIIIIDGTATVQVFNRACEVLFGYRAAEVIGQNVKMLMPEPYRGEHDGYVANYRKSGVKKIIGIGREVVGLRKDGTTFPMEVSVGQAVHGDAPVFVGIMRDITEAKRATVELERHREHLEELVAARTAEIAETTGRLQEREKFITTITDNLPGMVGYWDRDLRCRFANHAYVDWLGRTPEQMLGTFMQAVLGDAEFERRRAVIEAALAGEPQRFEVELRKPSGELGAILMHYIPDRRGEEVVGFFVLAIDVTPLKRAEAQLRQTNDRLADALAAAEGANLAKSQFLANMSHEIRTPMNGVLGMLEILTHTKLDDDQIRIVGTIGGSARSLLEIINDILDLSKIEAGQLKVEAIAADPTEIIESTTRLFLGAAAAKDLILRCFVAPTVRGEYLTDPTRLRQILSNLVSNAIKFTSRGGVTISADIEPNDGGAASLRIAVEDTGVGISPAQQVRLFQPFTQADDSTARKFGGTGLGLSICRRLADLMGGTIELDSVEGEGTRVTLALPARPIGDRTVQAALDLSGVRVALVTADAAERRYLDAYLAYWGADVTVVMPRSRLVVPPPEPFTLVLAPVSSMAEARLAAEESDALSAVSPQRFVFYSYDDPPTDSNPTKNSIATTALSRARIVTAVAVAAGRKSPEIEIAEPRPLHGSHRTPPSRDQAIRDGRLILLAEDHPVNRDVVLRQLHLLGYAADAVEDGVAALAALGRTRYGLLLTDCNMPDMDGFALTRCIRQGETDGRHLPIVALTANALGGEDQRCLAAGMDDYLSKPVEMATLFNRLERWLPGAPPGSTPSGPAPTAGPVATTATAAPVLDLTQLASYCGGDQAAIAENLKLFVDTMKSDLTRLSAAAAQSNADETKLLAHRMKGAARIVGGHRLAACCEALERSAGARDWGVIERDMRRLEAASAQIARLCDEMAPA